jgi:hypothetical protein
MACRALLGAVLALALLGAGPGGADAPATDASIVTGLDISDSVAATDARAQLAALAAAVRAPDFLAAIRRGRAGRIGMAVFAWHHYRFEILHWTVIGSPAEAAAAARVIETRIPVNVDREARSASIRFIGRLTDLSRALDHAATLEPPTDGGRLIVNIIGNGADNIGEPAAPARDRLLAGGATVNGVVFDADSAVAGYFRREVAGGSGAFVVVASEENFAEVMHRKLLQDLVAVNLR